MAQNNVEFIKKATYQIGKEFTGSTFDEQQKIQMAQEVLNAQINAGDLVTDAEMPPNMLGSVLNWSEGVLDDLLVGITTTNSNRLYIVQDLADENVKVEYQDRIKIRMGIKSSGGSVTIPRQEGYVADFIIDWGDGTISDVTSWDDDPAKFTHYYPGAFIEDIEIKGIIEYFVISNVAIKGVSMASAENLKHVGFPYCTMSPETVDPSCAKWRNVEIFEGLFKGHHGHWGNDLENLNRNLFKNCTKVHTFTEGFYGVNTADEDDNIPNWMFENMPLLENVSGMFNSCSDFTSIQPNFWENNPLITDFSYCFAGVSLTEIPTGLFYDFPNATSFRGTFANCAGITSSEFQSGEITGLSGETLFGVDVNSSPENNEMYDTKINMFDYNINVTDFGYVFYGTGITSIEPDLFKVHTKLTNVEAAFGFTGITEIPTGLFSNCPDINNFSDCFRQCDSLTTAPSDLFDYTTATDIAASEIFYSCSGFTTIPSDLFDNGGGFINLSGAFDSTIISSIPSGLFDNCTNVTDFSFCFSSVDLASIPSGLFDNCTDVTTFESVFSNNDTLATIPVDLFRYNTLVESFKSAFSSDVLLTELPDGLFDYNTAVTDFSHTFSSTPLTSVPVDLFRYNTLVDTFYRTFYRAEILTIPDDFFRYNTLVTNFSQLFYQVSELYSVPDELFRYNTLSDNFYQTFAYCSNLSGGVTGTGELYDWMQSHSPTTTGNCFSGCTALKDWELIPSAWGGGGLSATTNYMEFEIQPTTAEVSYDLVLGIYGTSGNLLDVEVDWGDGSSTTTLTGSPTVGERTHTYANGLSQRTLRITGNANYMNWDYEDALRSLGTVTGDCGLTAITCSQCDNLTSVDVSFSEHRSLTNMSYIFQSCNLLTSVPSGVFDNLYRITNIEGMFFGNTGITTLLSGVFDDLVSVTTAELLFSGCTSLSSIPTGLFDSMTEVLNFNEAFYNCTSLTTIPTDLFKYNTKAYQFYQIFMNSALTTIPVDLFRYCTAVFNFTGAFRNTDVTSVPANTFRYNILASNFSFIFYSCTSLITISADLFLYNVAITNISVGFSGSNFLTTAVTGANNLIDQVETNNASVVKTGCFNSCSAITDYASIPLGASDWRTV